MTASDAEVRRDDGEPGRKLQLFTGRALLVAATGIFIDFWAGSTTLPPWLDPIINPAGAGGGSIGLIPAYLGFTAGMACFVAVIHKGSGTWPGVLAGVGVVGMFIFWGSYPDHSTIGGLGSIVVGIAVLRLPGWARFASPLWVASGLMGVTELVRPGVNWGPISGFTLGGAAVAVTGAFVLWGLPKKEAAETTLPPIVEPSHAN